MVYFRSEYFNLLRELVEAEYRLKDKSTFLGLAWSLIHPVFMLGILFLLFSARMGKDIEHYGVFLLIGLVHYTHFSTATSSSMRVLLTMRQLTVDAVFPKELLVIASVLAHSIELLSSIIVCIVIAAFSGLELSGYLALLPFVLILQTVFALWVSLFLSCFFVFIKDLQHFYQIFLRALLFVTPIFYGIDFLGNGFARNLVSLNPLAALIDFSRTLLINITAPTFAQISLWGVFHAAMLVLGFGVFRHFEPAYAEKV